MIREINYNEVYESQVHFRILLDSMARPGKVNNIGELKIQSPDKLNKTSALIGFALLNSEATFFTSNNSSEIADYFIVNTNAKQADIKHADFVFINGTDDGAFLLDTNTGILEYPEKSATIVIDVDNIYDVPKDQTHEIILKGPGVDGEKRVYVRNISSTILQSLKEQNNEYPLGVDIILTDNDGNIICIPRSNNFSWN